MEEFTGGESREANGTQTKVYDLDEDGTDVLEQFGVRRQAV